MKTLPIDASDDEIRLLVLQWSELMAAKQFEEALSILNCKYSKCGWTPELLENTIRGYGIPDIDHATKQIMLEDWGVEEFEVTTLIGYEGREDIINSIKIKRENLGLLDPTYYLGHVHYYNLPLCNERSDLTARFHILRIGANELALELLDIHVL